MFFSTSGFPTGIENIVCVCVWCGEGGGSSKFDGGRGLSQHMGKAWGLKML